MYAVISPAKKLNCDAIIPFNLKFQNDHPFSAQTKKLVTELKKLTAKDIESLMKLSGPLAQLNYQRFQDFFDKKISLRPAIYTFAGDTYVGLDAYSLSERDIKFAQNHLGVLSGLYGILSPLDGIRPYRLEMGCKFSCGEAKNLYQFWGEQVTDLINQRLAKSKILVNLASNEYFSVVNTQKITGKIVTPIFKEKRADQYKVIGIKAKRARGEMARFIIQNKTTKIDDLKDFTGSGYKYSKKLSSESELVFLGKS